MKLLKTVFLLLLFFSSAICTAQDCKYPKKMSKLAQKHFTEEKVAKVTKFKTLFKKFSKVGSGFFVKSDKGNYLGFSILREFGARIDLNDDNPIQLHFTNNSIITIYPDKSVPGKFALPVTSEVNRAYYKIDQDQLNLLASTKIKYIKIYYTLKKPSSDIDRSVDDLGMFMDFEILKENYQTNWIELANCIQQ